MADRELSKADLKQISSKRLREFLSMTGKSQAYLIRRIKAKKGIILSSGRMTMMVNGERPGINELADVLADIFAECTQNSVSDISNYLQATDNGKASSFSEYLSIMSRDRDAYEELSDFYKHSYLLGLAGYSIIGKAGFPDAPLSASTYTVEYRGKYASIPGDRINMLQKDIAQYIKKQMHIIMDTYEDLELEKERNDENRQLAAKKRSSK